MWRYGVAVVAATAALLLSELLRPIVVPNPFIFVFAAIALSAGYGGLGPGLLATALAVLGVNYILIPPFYTFKVASLDLVRLGTFAIVALLVSSYSAARRRAEEAAQRRGEQLRVTLASIGDAVIATDADGRVTFLNAVAALLTGWSAADADGQPIDAVFRIVNANTREPVESPVSRVLRDGLVVGLANHTILLGRDGVERPIDDSGAPIRDSEGQLIGVVLVFRDFTKREQADATRSELLHREQLARIVAERAREQLAFLAEAGAVLSSSLDYTTTLRHVASLAVPRMGDWCAVDVLDEGGRLERLVVVHTDPAKVALAEEVYRRYPPNPAASSGAWHVIRTGEAVRIPQIDDDMLVAGAQDAEHLALLRALGMRAALTVPLLAGERILGTLTLVMAESGRGYEEVDREVALSLGRRAGLAIEKAQLYAAEQRARLAAEQVADRLGRLQRVTGALAAVLQPEDVARVVTEQVVQALGATASAVMSYDPVSRTLQLLHATGYGEAFLGWERFSADGPYPFGEVVRDGRPIYVPARAAFNARYPELATSRTISEAAAYLPLLVDGQAIGGISIGFAAVRELDVEERMFLEALAAQCAQALDRARLFGAEQRARERLAFLAEASTQLVASLDYQVTLEQITRLCVPRLADWCVVDRLADDGTIVMEILTHTDPAKVQWARAMRERFVVHIDQPVGASQVIRTGEPLLMSNITDEVLQLAARDEEELRMLRIVGYSSLVVVPLRAHDRIIGSIGLVTTNDSNRQLTPDDVTLAEELARRAGVALDNARLYQAAAEARVSAEQASQRVTRLQEITAALGATMTPEQVSDLMVHEGLAALGADAGVVFLLADEGRMWEAVSFRGYPPELAPRHVRSPVDAPGPLSAARECRQLVLVQTPEELLRRWPNLAEAQARSGDAALVAVPLVLDQEVLGVLTAAFRAPRRFSTDDQAFLEALGRQCAQALDRARLFAAEQEARAAAEEAVTLRDRFLSVASHELKTPLTSMLLQTQLLQRRVGRVGLLAEREQRTLQVVSEQAQRLDRMITSLLDISRLELGQLSLSRATVNLCALTQRVVTEVQPTTEAHIVTCAAPEEELLVDGDELRLEQVLQNLLQNAIKYSPDGGPIEVIVAPEAGQVCLTVTDRGMGFPADTAARLFERFYRAPNADPRQISGLGIGLYVVQEIMRLHGGSVRAEPQETGGSRFTVCLPQMASSEGG